MQGIFEYVANYEFEGSHISIGLYATHSPLCAGNSTWRSPGSSCWRKRCWTPESQVKGPIAAIALILQLIAAFVLILLHTGQCADDQALSSSFLLKRHFYYVLLPLRTDSLHFQAFHNRSKVFLGHNHRSLNTQILAWKIRLQFL